MGPWQGEDWPDMCTEAIEIVNRRVKHYIGREPLQNNMKSDSQVTFVDFSYLFLKEIDLVGPPPLYLPPPLPPPLRSHSAVGNIETLMREMWYQVGLK